MSKATRSTDSRLAAACDAFLGAKADLKAAAGLGDGPDRASAIAAAILALGFTTAELGPLLARAGRKVDHAGHRIFIDRVGGVHACKLPEAAPARAKGGRA